MCPRRGRTTDSSVRCIRDEAGDEVGLNAPRTESDWRRSARNLDMEIGREHPARRCRGPRAPPRVLIEMGAQPAYVSGRSACGGEGRGARLDPHAHFRRFQAASVCEGWCHEGAAVPALRRTEAIGGAEAPCSAERITVRAHYVDRGQFVFGQFGAGASPMRRRSRPQAGVVTGPSRWRFREWGLLVFKCAHGVRGWTGDGDVAGCGRRV